MLSETTQVSELLEKPLAEAGYILEDVTVTVAGKRKALTVIIDRDIDTTEPVSMGDIASATRIVSQLLDDKPVFNNRSYTLEVTSPGAERELTEERHYRRVIGRTIAVKTTSETVTGVLEAINDTTVRLTSSSTETVEVPRAEIVQAAVVVQL